MIIDGIYQLFMKFLANLFNSSRDDLHYPNRNWTLSVRRHLNNSLGEEVLKRQFLNSKPISFLSHPIPECSCTISKSIDDNECPKWLKDSFLKSRSQENTIIDENEQHDDETDEGHLGLEDERSNYSTFEQDQELDLNDLRLKDSVFFFIFFFFFSLLT